jgi:HEAT repeat protein
MKRSRFESLLHDIEHGDAITSCEASKQLALMKGRGTASRLARIMRGAKTPESRYAAAWALSQPEVRSVQVMPALIEALEDAHEDMDVRGQAAESLGLLFGGRVGKAGYERVGHTLVGFLEHPDPALRFWCAYALGQLGFRPALPTLRLLAHGDERLYKLWWTVGEEAEDAMDVIEGRRPQDREFFAQRIAHLQSAGG